jgi:predicted phosphodiesterase
VLDLNGKKVGLIHGWGPPSGMRERVSEQFKGVDAILYGHTHTPDNVFIEGVLFFNPGSASGKYPAIRRTYGILSIEESIHGEIITIG